MAITTTTTHQIEKYSDIVITSEMKIFCSFISTRKDDISRNERAFPKNTTNKRKYINTRTRVHTHTRMHARTHARSVSIMYRLFLAIIIF